MEDVKERCLEVYKEKKEKEEVHEQFGKNMNQDLNRIENCFGRREVRSMEER